MKNIHLIPTDKPSRLLYFGTSKELTLQVNLATFRTFERSTQHIYITSDEEAKEGDWGYIPFQEGDVKLVGKYFADDWKKIILTTDQDLINNGVQAINDEFIEWFIKNPSCEEVEVGIWSNLDKDGYLYHIIIPKEEQKQHLIDIMRGDEELGLYDEPKQETLEEAAENYGNSIGNKNGTAQFDFIRGAKWQQERMCSEEEIIQLIQFLSMSEEFNEYGSVSKETANYFMRQFKNK